MINQVTIGGRIAREPETRSAGGTSVTNFTVAVGEKYKDKTTGETKEKTAWVRVVAWGKTGEIAGALEKGSEVVVIGKIETRQWEDKEGNKREATEINAFSVYPVAGRNPKIAQSMKSQRGRADANQAALDDEIQF